MAKRGRPRKAGNREPSGRLSRAAERVIPREVLEQRARAVGVNLTEARERVMRDQRLGTALGVLWMRGKEGKPGIDERQYRAGESLASLWRQWAAMAACPPRTSLNGDGSSGGNLEADVERWERIDASFKRIRMAVWALPAGVPAWRLIEKVVMDDTVPEALNERTPSVWFAVREALDEIARHFRIPKDLAA